MSVNTIRNNTLITGYLELLSYLDLKKNELRNAVIQVLSSEPSTPVTGQFFYNSTLGKIGYYSGSAWVYLGGTFTASQITDFANVAKDAAGAALLDTFSINFTYNGGTHQITADVRFVAAGGLEAVAGGVQIKDQALTPGTFCKYTVNQKGIITSTGSLVLGDLPTHNSMHTGMRLDEFAVPTADVSLNNLKITNLADPVNPQDGVNLRTAQVMQQGFKGKGSVKTATTANITLSGGQTIDSIAVGAGDRVLVKDQIAPANNGIYVVAVGAWTRALDTDLWLELVSAYVWVEQGASQADTGWNCTIDQGGTLGTTSITWVQFNGAGSITAGAGLTKTGNTLDANVDGVKVIITADAITLGASVVTKATGTFTGNGATASFTLTHNLNTYDVSHTIRQSADKNVVLVPVLSATVNSITVEFSPAPTNGEVFTWKVD